MNIRIDTTLHEFHQRELQELALAMNDGNELAASAALFYCAQHKIPAPAWVIECVSKGHCELLRGNLPKKLGRSAGPIKRYVQDMKDYVRWETVQTVREKQKELSAAVSRMAPVVAATTFRESEKLLHWAGRDWLRAYECASMLVRGTPAFGGPDTMKSSYLRVEKNFQMQKRPLRYRFLAPDFLESIGETHPMFWGRGRKVASLYDLTL